MAEDIAEQLAKKQRTVAVSEFFERNRHLLGFDNKRKALLTVVKEAVDNSLDACEEANIMPEIYVEIIELENEKYRVIIEDNGPGIVKKQIPNIFAKLLYGSKFHTMRQQRGQQGIGISAAVLYSQLTTGRPAKIISRTSQGKPANYFELYIDTKTNNPTIVHEKETEWKGQHGTRIELDIEASYIKGDASVDQYIKQTAIVNPHATITYISPKAEQYTYAKATEDMPKQPKEIKPHPYGVEVGVLLRMLKDTEKRTLQAFFCEEFSRIGPGTAKEICANALLDSNLKPQEITHSQAEMLINGIKRTKIIAPSTDCIVPIGADLLKAGIQKEIKAEFFASVTRPPKVYRGIPFVVEVALAYGGELPKEENAKLLRFANRVPLLYQQSACAFFKSMTTTNWRSYGMSQSTGSLPQAPLIVALHLASVWPPFTSEAKEAIAHYPEIIAEARLALQEAGRQLSIYINKRLKVAMEQERVNIFETYIPEVSSALAKLTGNSKTRIEQGLKAMLEKNKDFIAKNQTLEP